MEKKELMDSGILEAYVLGMSTSEEAALVDKMAASDSEIQKEKEEIESVLELLAQRFAVQPPSQQQIRSTIESQLFLDKSEEKEAIVRPIQSGIKTENSKNLTWFSIAASILLVLSFSYIIKLRSHSGGLEEQMVAMKSESVKMLEMNEKLAGQSHQFSRLTQSMGEEGTRQVVLTSTVQQPSKAIVFWNPVNRKVWLVNTSLPSLPPDKQYQLWGIVDGKPVDAGVFDANTGNSMIAVELKSIDRPKMMAVTVENRGGVASPTMSTLCLKADI